MRNKQVHICRVLMYVLCGICISIILLLLLLILLLTKNSNLYKRTEFFSRINQNNSAFDTEVIKFIIKSRQVTRTVAVSLLLQKFIQITVK